jgi:hypothetical protein
VRAPLTQRKVSKNSVRVRVDQGTDSRKRRQGTSGEQTEYNLLISRLLQSMKGLSHVGFPLTRGGESVTPCV